MIESVEVVIRQPGFPDRVVPLPQGTTQMGRGDDNEIVLSDVGVSRKHAQIRVTDAEVCVEDLGSGNGTYYFGHKVSSQPLRDQDEVVIDPFVLHFRIQGGAPAGTGEAPTVAAEPESARIEVVVGNGMVGSLFPIGMNGLTMGRAEDRDVVVPDPASSRHHCHITAEHGEYVLHDNGSANGVFVNAVRVRECTLSNGDLIRIGNTEMRFVNPSAQVAEMMAAAADPMRSAPEPAVDFPVDPHPRQPISHASGAGTRKKKKGKGGILAALVGILLALIILVLALAVVAVAIVLFLMQASAPPPALPAEKPMWSLAGDLPTGERTALDDQGRKLTSEGKHADALPYYLAVLQTEPGDNTAAKFAAYSGLQLVVSELESQKDGAVADRRAMERRRGQLLDQVRNRRLRDKARARLDQEFRDDLVVQEAMEWGLTQKQVKFGKDIDKARDQIQLQDRHAEGIRLLRRLLEEAVEGEYRNQAHQLIEEGVQHQAQQVAPRWRDGVLADARGEDARAKELLKAVMGQDASNASAAVRLKLL